MVENVELTGCLAAAAAAATAAGLIIILLELLPSTSLLCRALTLVSTLIGGGGGRHWVATHGITEAQVSPTKPRYWPCSAGSGLARLSRGGTLRMNKEDESLDKWLRLHRCNFN